MAPAVALKYSMVHLKQLDKIARISCESIRRGVKIFRACSFEDAFSLMQTLTGSFVQ
jgi:hypothetical protein